MDILLKSAKIIDEESAYHGAVKDILISDGVIKQISNHIAAEGVDKVLKNTCISQGWTDSSVCFGEPGFEERETLENGMLTAQRSGFTPYWGTNGRKQGGISCRALRYAKWRCCGFWRL